MAHNYQLKRHSNGYWYVHWSENRRTKRKTTNAVERKDAEIFRAKWLLKRLSSSPGEAPLSKLAPNLHGARK